MAETGVSDADAGVNLDATSLSLAADREELDSQPAGWTVVDDRTLFIKVPAGEHDVVVEFVPPNPS